MIIVSVSVSMAVSPMTGAASFRRIRLISETSLPRDAMALVSAALIPWILAGVPLVPVVITEALERKRTGSLPTHSPIHTSVVELPISTPARIICFFFLPDSALRRGSLSAVISEESLSFHKPRRLPAPVSRSWAPDRYAEALLPSAPVPAWWNGSAEACCTSSG